MVQSFSLFFFNKKKTKQLHHVASTHGLLIGSILDIALYCIEIPRSLFYFHSILMFYIYIQTIDIYAC